jgi:hypothetical protein
MLLKNGADMNMRNNNGRSAFQIAHQGWKVGVVNIFMRAGVTIPEGDEYQYMRDMKEQLQRERTMVPEITAKMRDTTNKNVEPHLSQRIGKYLGGKRKTRKSKKSKRKTRKAKKKRRSRKRAGADTPDSSYNEGKTDEESISVDPNEPFHANIGPIALANEVHELEMGLLDDSFASEEPDESIGTIGDSYEYDTSNGSIGSIGSIGTIGDGYEYDTSNGSIGSIGPIGDGYEYDTSNGSIGSIDLEGDTDDHTLNLDASLSLGGRNRRRRSK